MSFTLVGKGHKELYIHIKFSKLDCVNTQATHLQAIKDMRSPS